MTRLRSGSGVRRMNQVASNVTSVSRSDFISCCPDICGSLMGVSSCEDFWMVVEVGNGAI